jgi:ubiquinone/menaquinone biosynthesis C-methylase UbiE
MNHRDHVGLIREGVEGAGASRLELGARAGASWLELGAGEGAFTLALADVLGSAGGILATDRDGAGLAAAAAAVAERFPATHLETQIVDFTVGMPDGPFDGVLAANTLHFVKERRATLEAIRRSLGPGGRLVIVEYDADRGNPWVPHPFSFESWRSEAMRAGFEEPRLIGRVPSRFLGAIYGAVAGVGTGLVHSRPHGGDREE